MFERQKDDSEVWRQTHPLRSVLYYCQKSETQQIIELESLFDTMLRLRVSGLSVHQSSQEQPEFYLRLSARKGVD